MLFNFFLTVFNPLKLRLVSDIIPLEKTYRRQNLMEKNKYLIVGAGRSGIAAAKMLSQLGGTYVIYDANENLDTAAVCEKIGEKDIPFILGGDAKGQLDGIDICVVSPGVSLETPVMQTVLSAGITVYSEIELAYRYDKGQVLAITGTNGKTTTTSLTYEIMKSVNDKTLLVGALPVEVSEFVSLYII